MDYYLFSAQNATIAQKMVQILQECGIAARMQRMPAALTRQGCGFAVRISREDGYEAYRCLSAENVVSKHIYLSENRVYREVIL